MVFWEINCITTGASLPVTTGQKDPMRIASTGRQIGMTAAHGDGRSTRCTTAASISKRPVSSLLGSQNPGRSSILNQTNMENTAAARPTMVPAIII